MRIRRRALDTWLDDLEKGWGVRAAASAAAAAPLLRDARNADLRSVGAVLAVHGHSLEEVLEWFDALAGRSRPFRLRLQQGGTIDLAAGWAGGVLDDTDGAAALAPWEALRMRVREQVRLAESVGEAPGRHLALVMVEALGPEPATTVALRHVQRVFADGEPTAIAPNGKIVVLVPRDPEVRRRTLQLTDALRRDAQLLDTSLRVWVEPLAMSAEHVDSHLLDLAG